MSRLDGLLARAGVRAGERPAVLLLVAYSFGVGMFYAFYVAIASASFLAEFESSWVPWGYIISGVVGSLAMTLFSTVGHRAGVRAVLLWNLIAVIALLALFFLGLQLPFRRAVIFSMFIAMAPLLTLMDVGFWTLANNVFNLEQGKRLFGLIGAGEPLSAVIMFAFIPVLISWIPNNDSFLLFAAAGVGLSALAYLPLAPRLAAAGGRAKAGGTEVATDADSVPRRYFRLIAGVTLLFMLTHYFVDYSFLATSKAEFGSQERIGKFVSVFFGVSKAAELGSKLVLSGWLVRQFGLGMSLLVLPVSVLAACVLAGVTAVAQGTGADSFFGLIVLAKFLVFVLRKSIFEPSFKVLYQPLPAAQRFAAQARVDGVVKQVGLGISGAALVAASLLGPAALQLVVLALVVILSAWLALSRPMLAEYRQRLFDTLASLPPQKLLDSPIEALRGFLRRAGDREVRYALNALDRVEPVLHNRFAIELVDSESPVVRREVLDRIAELQLVEARERVAERIAIEPEHEVRLAAQATLAELREREAATADAYRSRARSEDPRQRREAALAFARAGDEPSEALFDLMWDPDPAVRRTALLSAGQAGARDYWPRLVDHLPLGEFCKAAAAALVGIGEPVLPALETAFRRFAGDTTTLTRLLRIYERIGGREAERLLFERIDSPVRRVRRQALASLNILGFRARAEQAGVVKKELEATVDALAWFTASRLDLAEVDEAAVLLRGLDDDIARERESVSLLLALLCDAQAIKMMQRHIDGDSAEDRAFALEIAEQLVPPDLKDALFPIFDQSPPAQMLARLDLHFPQRRLAPVERLEEILGRGSTRVHDLDRAAAIDALARLGEGVNDALLANLYASSAMVAELAARRLAAVEPRELARRLATLAPERADALRRLVAASHDDHQPQLLIYERCLILEATPLFSRVPLEILAAFAARVRERRVTAGTALFREGDPGRTMYVVLEGKVRIDKEGRTLSEVGADQLLGEIAAVETGSRTASATVVEPVRLLEIEQEAIYDLMAEQMEIIPGLIEVIARRHARG